MANPRIVKLNKLFEAVVRGKQQPTRQNASLFLEAVYSQEDRVACVQKLGTSDSGLSSLQTVVFVDVSIPSLNGNLTELLQFLQAPTLKDLAGGTFLRPILKKIVEPPVFWNAFTTAFCSRQLQDNAQQCFGWLLLHLVSLPGDESSQYRELARDRGLVDALVSASQADTRALGQRIKHILDTVVLGASADDDYGPGGRHDNDFVNFRQIAIMPTADEVVSREPPFMRMAAALDELGKEERAAGHLDNGFRLLREDMLFELREELQIALGQKKGRHRGLVVDDLTLVDLYRDTSSTKKSDYWSVKFACKHDLWFFKNAKPTVKDRQRLLADDKKLIKHGSLAGLIIDGIMVAFPTIRRVEELLAQMPPTFVLQFEGKSSTISAFMRLRRATSVRLVQIDTALFAYEPVLKSLQDITSMPLSDELFLWGEGSTVNSPPSTPSRIIQAIENNPIQDLRPLLQTPKSIILDSAQATSLLSGLKQRVSLIQGPPGTGKSFIGALLAKISHDFTSNTILVCCYTNHALDQFLEDLLDIGIPPSAIVRLGGKATTRTEPLSLYKQNHAFKLGRVDWTMIDSLKAASTTSFDTLDRAFDRYKRSTISQQDIMDHLEFEASDYYEAFRVPASDSGMQRVGKRGKAVDKYYLLDRWVKGRDAGIFKHDSVAKEASQLWNMKHKERQEAFGKWEDDLFKEQIEALCDMGEAYNKYQAELEFQFGRKEIETLKSKRIIGCTTTAAAKYTRGLRAASPDVLLVEEAGEILEDHILTALGPETQQLILIGDHKQLRPKVNNYQLTVEKGEGYNLNQSLFERLVSKGYPHHQLTKQHRMRPEIAALVRNLTYSELVDADGTKNRPDLRGVRDNVVFIGHAHPEDENADAAELRDMGSKSSKQNTYEVEMVLKITRYLAQQGYGTDKVVILTPYLGQLHKIQQGLKKDNDPVLNDMDSYDLVRAGLLSEATAKLTKNRIRLATIDNYQGEESDIVIISLTRSNVNHDIGFLFAPERLNVLLSRARDALIILGNPETFAKSRKGGELWTRLFDLLRRGNHIYDGLPTRCERHPDRIALLRHPADFDEICPDGGCQEPCGTMLKCGLHACPSKCHQLSDHSKMACEAISQSRCLNGHPQSFKCKEGQPLTCRKCEADAKRAQEQQKRALEAQRRRDAEQQEHTRKIAELNEQIAAEQEAQQDIRLAEERAAALQNKSNELEAAKKRTTKAASSSLEPPDQATSAGIDVGVLLPPAASNPRAIPTPPAPPSTQSQDEEAVSNTLLPSPSQKEWQRQKDMEGADNEHIDAIMDMTGLEDVKVKVLEIKAKIDVSKRQNTSAKEERFNIVLLGNPGTGKTTVARHYAKFLTSVDVIPGDVFIETTGSRLANDGVPAAKKQIEEVMKGGGGAIFIDEAYQLTSSSNFGGSQVLDFLLAEMENNVGKMVFILAGYNKQMEKFFEHNPGLMSRVPHRLQFADYSDEELRLILAKQIDKKWKGQMKVELGVHGLYSRVAVRRLGRGRGRDGFGNARALQNMFSQITSRQAARITKQRRDGIRADDFFLVQEDLIGPDPSSAIVESKAWKKLQELTGLGAVKESIQNLYDLINENYKRELVEKEPIQMSLNRVFLGSPGTGKTTVAKLYGQVLADLGLLSNGEVVVKNPSDFIGSVLGASEENTKKILATTAGKVLVIDEAYGLYGGASGAGSNQDQFKTAVIDTIVAEVQSVPGEDRCVLMLGYEAQMREMFQDVNPGLSRRFAIEDAFRFEDFTDSELLEILNLKLKQQQLEATGAAKQVAIEVLSRARNRPHFGNGGEVENLLSKAKARYQTRRNAIPLKDRTVDFVFEQQDFDPGFDRAAHSATNLKKLFEDVIGCDKIVDKLEEYQNIPRVLKAQGKEAKEARDLIPTNFIFKGPPGTGKTTIARKMGQVYFDMGLLSSTDVVECSASDLVGEYVGQTGPKTKKLFEKALGKVLFIDEAYRLSEGHFAKEAIDELVAALTSGTFMSKLVVILAGYDQDMNKLLFVNSGLRSRFPEEIVFENMEPDRCLQLLAKELTKRDIRSAELEDPNCPEYEEMVIVLEALASMPSWGNARDIITLSKKMVRIVMKNFKIGESGSPMAISGKDVVSCMRDMLKEQYARHTNVPSIDRKSEPTLPMQDLNPPAPVGPSIQTNNSTKAAKPPPPQDEAISDHETEQRDPGVPEHVWRQLQADKRAAIEEAKRKEAEMKELEKTLEEAKRREEAMRAEAERLRQEEANKRAAEEELRRREEAMKVEAERLRRQRARDKAAEEQLKRCQEAVRAEAERLRQERARQKAAEDELKRRREQQRLQELRAKAERERIERELEEQRRREEEERRKEAQAQTKLRSMGVCPVGYQWIKQSLGYRCAAGGHYVSDAQLGL